MVGLPGDVPGAVGITKWLSSLEMGRTYVSPAGMRNMEKKEEKMRNSRPECIEALETFWEKRMSGEEKEKWLLFLRRLGLVGGKIMKVRVPTGCFTQNG